MSGRIQNGWRGWRGSLSAAWTVEPVDFFYFRLRRPDGTCYPDDRRRLLNAAIDAAMDAKEAP